MRVTRRRSFSLTRACAITLCAVLLLTSQPVAFFRGASFSQGLSAGNAGELRTRETPLKNLPDLAKAETEKMKLGSFRIPEGQPATRCRHHDEKCKAEKKEKIGWLPERGSNHRTQIAAVDNARLASPFRWDAPNFLTDALIGATGPAKAAKTATAAAVQTMQDIMKSARLDPQYRQGGSGEDLYSRNYHWDFPLINLPGRAGMDLTLSLNYNSLTWVKRDGFMFFDPETSPLSPGFTLNFPYFPKFHTAFQNANNSRYVLWLLLPNGGSVELRDSGDADLYESADSTYTQYKKSTKTLTTSDGTRYYYPNGYMCTRITDRNGNYISITYVGSSASIDTITDTAGRVVKFTYDPTYYSLQSIALQTGPTSYRTLATFSYVNNTLGLNFAGLGIVNAWNGMTYPVLRRVTRYDGYFWEFDHSCYGQVNRFRRNPTTSVSTSPELVEIFYDVAYNTTVAQSDCPRFTNRYLQGYEVMPGNSNWVSSSFEFNQGAACGNVTMPNGTVIDATALSCGTIISPDTLVRQKTYFYNNTLYDANNIIDPNYRFRGLPLLTVNYDFMTAKKYEQTKWEQTDGYTHQSNPRIFETLICDTSGNKKRTAIKYRYAGASVDLPYNLPAEVCEYANDTTTLLRRTVTEYNLNTAYTSRRILGLPQFVSLYDGAGGLASKAGYFYDGLDVNGTTNICSDCMAGLPGSVNALQHEYVAVTTGNPTSPGYPATFIMGRGNLTNVRRYDVTNSSYVESKTGYNLTGSVVFARDPLGSLTRQTKIEYDDAYYDNATMLANLNSFAYPTKVTDPDGYFSTTAYEYYWGVVKKQTNPKGATVRSDYDPTTGLLQRVTNEVNSAYTRYEYDAGKTWVKTYATVNDLVQANELMSMNCLDGFDRTRAIITEHPGSSGGYKIKQTLFTARGQTWKDYDWAETTGGWNCAGDDAAGFCKTEYTYDWKERPTKIKNADGTSKDFTYEGCGCAGGTVTTALDEGTVITDAQGLNPQTKRRQTKTYQDNFGRVMKTQLMSWEGGAAYSTSVNTYNVRDQVTCTKEYSGPAAGTEACPSPTCQKTDTTYDGHGRLWKQRRPTETADSTYLYHNDDTVSVMTDPRGISATYAYNSRRLVTGVTYDSLPNAVLETPATDIPDTLVPNPSTSVTFTYDSVGNRLTMDDAPGNLTYTYDTLSRLTQETRVFDAAGTAKTFTLQYQYNLAGQIKQITDPWNATLTYNRDKAGQETSLIGTGYKDHNQWTNRPVGTFAENLKYRAWGDIKQFNNGSPINNGNFAMSYDNRLRLTGFTGGNRTTEHDYYNDGLVKEVRDLHYGSNFLRKYEYDQATRLAKARAGGTASSVPSTSPYSLTYGYDAWGNRTSRTGTNWAQVLAPISSNYTDPVTNNQTGRDRSMSYDAAGNPLWSSGSNHYNAAGQLFIQYEESAAGLALYRVRENRYDGDGIEAYTKTSNFSGYNGLYTKLSDRYLIRSSALGGAVIAECKEFVDGNISSKSYVYLRGVQLAFQAEAHRPTDKYVVWAYHNPVVGSYFAQYQLNNSSGQAVTWAYAENVTDPLGSAVGATEPVSINVQPPFVLDFSQYITEDSLGKCYADYVLTPCNFVTKWLNSGTAEYAPWDNTRTTWNRRANGGRGGWQLEIYSSENGFFGFRPTGGSSWGGSRPKLLPKGSLASTRGEEEDEKIIPKIDHLPTSGGLFTKKAYQTEFYPIIYDFVNNPDCVSAFSAVGVDLVKLLTGKGIRLGPRNTMKGASSEEIKKRLGLTQAGFDNFKEAHGKDFNAATFSRSEFLVEGSLPTILIGYSGYSKGIRNRAQTLAHELVHAGGIQGRGGVAGWKSLLVSGPASKPHDLDHISGFDDLIEKCTGKY